MNSHMIHGRLTRDPELTRGSEASKDRTNFTIAVDRRYGDETDFFDCVIFGKRAGVIEKYFRKGSEIMVVGEGQLRTYEDRVGNKRKAYSVVVADFDFCGSKNDSKGNYASSNDSSRTGQISAEFGDIPDSFEAADDDVPF